jgi:hypothetical protein
MIGTMFFLTPIAGMTFPALVPIITAAAGAMGYKAMMDLKDGGDLNEALRVQLKETQTVPVRLEESILDQMAREVGRAEALRFERDGVTVTIQRDERGRLRIDVTGPEAMNKSMLHRIGQEFAREVAQQFAYHRAMQELQKLNADVVEEQVDDKGEIRLQVRRWR